MTAHPPQPNPAPRDVVARRGARLVLLLVAAAVATAVGVLSGPAQIPWSEALAALLGSGSPHTRTILVELRLPRAAAALCGGAALGASGLLMQTLFRNALAGPYVLGVSSGAGLAVAVLVLAGTTVSGWLGSLGLAGSAMLGATATLVLVAAAARRLDTTTLLVLGILLGATTSALTTVLLAFASADQLQAFVVWTFGSFAGVTNQQLLVLVPAVAVGLGIAAALAKPLDALHLGDGEATSLGVSVGRTRHFAMLATGILAGVVTAFCGPIGFLGVAMPHLARAILGTASHRWLVPGSAAAGALAAAVADTIVQWPGSAVALPLSAVTALVGAPWLAVAILRNPGWREAA